MEVTVSVRNLRRDIPSPLLGMSHCLLEVSQELTLQGKQLQEGKVTRKWDPEGHLRGSLVHAISISVCMFVNTSNLLVFVSTFVELKNKISWTEPVTMQITHVFVGRLVGSASCADEHREGPMPYSMVGRCICH